MALVFGATERAMRSRLNEILKNNINSKEIFILSGARDLWLDAQNNDPCCANLVAKRINEKLNNNNIDEDQVKTIGSKIFNDTNGNTDEKRKEVVSHFEKEYQITWPTEADAANYIISEQDESIKLKAKVVDAPKKADGSRPDTLDTIIALQKQYPAFLSEDKTAVTISDQPNIVPQAVTLKLLPANIQTTIVGKGANKEKKTLAEELLSSFAGMVYKHLQLENFLQQNPQVSISLKTAQQVQKEESKNISGNISII